MKKPLIIKHKLQRPFEWDHFSDQPKIIRDKRLKHRMRLAHWDDLVKTFLTAGVAIPAACFHMALQALGRTSATPALPNPERFFGMGIGLDKGDAQFELVEELGVKNLLLRLPLWDLDRLLLYKQFIERWHAAGYRIAINLLQNPSTLTDSPQLTLQAQRIFDALQGIVQLVQVGNAVNRLKCGFCSVSEYLDFYKAIELARDQIAPQIQLCGPAVIDFEFHWVARAIFNAKAPQFDYISALLYVDRCGHPDTRQYGIFDTATKIRLLQALATLSPQVKGKRIVITEVNWPLSDRAPFSPTSEKEAVSEETYADYMLDYHRAARSTGMVETVYWHQLIAPGYGLVDSRGGSLRKMRAFASYREMVQKTHANFAARDAH